MTRRKITDEDRRAAFTRMLDGSRFLQDHIPGGLDGAMVIASIGLGRITGHTTTVSDAANMTGFSRSKVLRLLPALAEGGWVRVEEAPGRTYLHSTFPNPGVAGSWMDRHIERMNAFTCQYWQTCHCRSCNRLCSECVVAMHTAAARGEPPV